MPAALAQAGRRLEGPVNIGCPQYVTVDELAATVADVAGKKVNIRHVEGPVGVQSRNFSNERIYSTGWRARYFLKDGIACTYPCVEFFYGKRIENKKVTTQHKL